MSSHKTIEAYNHQFSLRHSWSLTEHQKNPFVNPIVHKCNIILEVETETSLYVGECKWTNKKIHLSGLNHLEESSKALKTKKQIRKVLFSKKGFEFNEANDTLLFDPEKIETEINKLP